MPKLCFFNLQFVFVIFFHWPLCQCAWLLYPLYGLGEHESPQLRLFTCWKKAKVDLLQNTLTLIHHLVHCHVSQPELRTRSALPPYATAGCLNHPLASLPPIPPFSFFLNHFPRIYPFPSPTFSPVFLCVPPSSFLCPHISFPSPLTSAHPCLLSF